MRQQKEIESVECPECGNTEVSPPDEEGFVDCVEDKIGRRARDRVWARVWVRVSDRVSDRVSERVWNRVRDRVSERVSERVRRRVRFRAMEIAGGLNGG